jgi:hypothetical protein
MKKGWRNLYRADNACYKSFLFLILVIIIDFFLGNI